MYKNTLVSILIPVYNRENLIEETVESALAQTYKNIEIIIVDNCSTDSTWKKLKTLAEKDKRIKIFQNETNVGPVRNWKRCIDEASGKYGKILWSDDLIAPNFLEKTLYFLEQNKDIGFVFTGTEIFNNDNKQKRNSHFIGKSGVYDSDKYVKGILFESKYPISPGCALFRLKDLKENLLLDIPNKVNSNFAMHAIGNDLLLFLLTANIYPKFAFVNEKLSFFRVHNESISIQSNNEKLSLHYALAKTYFVENYRINLIKKMNTNLYILIKKFSDAKKYNLHKIENFYLQNTNYSIDSGYLMIKIVNKIIDKYFK